MMRSVLVIGAVCCVAGCFSPSDRVLMGEVVDAGDDGGGDAATKDARGSDSGGGGGRFTGNCSPTGSPCMSDADCCGTRCSGDGYCR